MKIMHLDRIPRRMITAHGSEGADLAPIAEITSAAHLNLLEIGSKGVVGFHQAACPQVFLVLEGEGWVRGES